MQLLQLWAVAALSALSSITGPLCAVALHGSLTPKLSLTLPDAAPHAAGITRAESGTPILFLLGLLVIAIWYRIRSGRRNI